MKPSSKPIEEITISDFQLHPVWKFESKEKPDETMVSPVKKLPVKNLDGKVLGCETNLGNGHSVWSMLGNVDVENPEMNQHFLSISVEKDGKWFHLSRYFDPDYERNGPQALAKFLGLGIESVFPISYDLTKYVTGKRACLVGSVLKEPKRKLSRSERLDLIID